MTHDSDLMFHAWSVKMFMKKAKHAAPESNSGSCRLRAEPMAWRMAMLAGGLRSWGSLSFPMAARQSSRRPCSFPEWVPSIRHRRSSSGHVVSTDAHKVSSHFTPCRDHEDRFCCSDFDLFNAERFGL